MFLTPSFLYSSRQRHNSSFSSSDRRIGFTSYLNASWLQQGEGTHYDRISLCTQGYMQNKNLNGKIFDNQELLAEKSTTTLCGVNYHLLSVMLLQWLMSYARFHSTPVSYNNGVRDGRSNLLVVSRTIYSTLSISWTVQVHRLKWVAVARMRPGVLYTVQRPCIAYATAQDVCT